MKILFFIPFLLLLFSCDSKKIADENTKSDTLKKQTTRLSNQNDINKTDFALNPVLGKEYQFESRLIQKIVQKMDTLNSETKHNQTIIYSLKPISKDTSGMFSFVAKFLEIEQNISSQMLTIQANTKKLSKEPTPLELFYATLVGKEFNLKIDSRGRKMELLGVDSLINQVIEQLMKRKEFKGVQKALLQQVIGSFFNSNELKKSFEKLFEIYPEKSLSLGESWKISKFTTEPIPANIINTFTLKSVKNDSIYIDMVSNIVFEKQKSKENEPKLVELSGKQNGNLIVDKSTGMLINSKLQQQIRMVYQIPPSKETNDKTVNISTNVNSTFYLTLK